ncbi:hypothetical protein CDV36_002342, partial [Fusarium kuroshium]
GGTWGERRERQKEFLDEDPVVFVIGAGQAGLEIAVRLRHVGLSTLIIDKNERVGDNWRKRYRTLMTHDPIHYCHLPFIPFPSDWPMFVPKDKLADWLESYANIMELNVWNRTFVKIADYDEQNKIWTVTVCRQGKDRTLKPRHIVFATGQSGDPITPMFPGTEYYKGMLYHGISHGDATAFGDLSQKKVVVVGSGNSSHDICQNFYENGAAQVTMLQRGGTYVISVDKGVALQHAGMYDEGGPPTEDADIYAQSLPIPIQFALKVFEAQKISEVDKELLEGLDKAGFLVDSGPDKSGIFRKYITKGGGYYIDVGCSQLIIDGKIKVRQCSEGIKNFDADGLVLADGSRLDADIVVLATGYDGMRSTALRALGKKIADRLDDIWDLDEQGEIRSMWRSSGHPHFWCMGGYVTQLEQRISEGQKYCLPPITNSIGPVDLEREFQAFKSHVNQHLPATTPPQQPQSPESHTTVEPVPTEAPSEIYPLPATFSRPSWQSYKNYCGIWFDRYHSWFPILHQPTILGLCEDDSSQLGSPASLILDAIAVVIISTQQALVDTDLDRDEFCRFLTDEIILAAIHDMSFRKLQALLILTMAEYGSGRMIDFWNLISLCKRISTQLGLRDLVAYSAMNFGFPSVLPPRMLQIPTTAVEREEKIRAFWAIDALDSASTLGVAWHLTVSRPEPAANLPCDEEIWRFPESVIDMYQFGSSEAPSSFSLYVRLVTNELWHVHNFLQQSCEPFSIISLSQRQEECDNVYQRLKSWQNDFEQLLTVHTPLYTDLLTHTGTPTQQPNSILIHCTIHSAIISLHQRLIFPVSLGEEDATHWEAAAERCLSSCDQMADVIRSADDETLGIINPHVIYCVFIAARFYLIYSKAMDLPLPNKLYLFIYALRVCGQIWHLAKLLHTVLEVASAEHAGSQVSHPLPVEFFDLQYFSLDIHAALRIWAGEKQGSLLREDHAVS